MNIRLATLDDAKSMDKLNRLEMPENYPISFWNIILSDQWNSSFVAHNDQGELVGYILTISEYNFLNFSRQAHIISFTVKSAYRKKNIAKELLKSSLNHVKNCHGIQSCTLNVRVDNEIALHLYTQFGFIINERKTAYYNDGTDAFGMYKNLE